MKQNIITREEAQKLDEMLTRYSDFEHDSDPDLDKLNETTNIAAKAIKQLLAANNVTHLAIPRHLGYAFPDNSLTIIDNQEGYSGFEMKNDYERAHIHRNPMGTDYGKVLLGMLDALDYYRENKIPKSDWGGENDVTRRLRQADEIMSEKIIPPHEENILGSECRVMTDVQFFSANGMRFHTFITFKDETPAYWKSSIWSEGYDESLNFDAMIELECGVHGIADLISHYNIPLRSVPEMLTLLAEAMKKDAEAKGFRSCKDFVPLLNELGVLYSMRTREQYGISGSIIVRSGGGDEWVNDDEEDLDDVDLDDEESEIDNIEYDEEGFEDPV